MNILRRLLGGETPKVEESRVNRAASNPTLDFVKAVWDAPALFNRATRRRVKLFGRIWKWDLNASEETRRTFVPRYMRRHFSATKPRSRRERRHRAYILRQAKRYGIGGL